MIGGDRDGNPSVIAAVTAETFRLHRGLAIERHRRSLHDLARRLSVSGRRCPPPPALAAWLEARRPLPARVAYLAERYAGEPYRLALSLLASDLEAASREDMTARLLEETPHRARAAAGDVQEVLDLVAAAMPAPLAGRGLDSVRTQFRTFGLHAARLDIREDAGRITAVLGAILDALGLVRGFADEDDRGRTERLRVLLAAPAPAALDLARTSATTEAAAETWRLFRLLARARDVYGPELSGPFVISMTKGAADVLGVLLLARWAGSAEGLQIAPLFETLDDLDAAPAILTALFEEEPTRPSGLMLGRADGDDRLLRQQQGQRIRRRELGALPRPGGGGARLPGGARGAHHLPRPRRQRCARRRPGRPRHSRPAVRDGARAVPADRAGRDDRLPLRRPRSRPPAPRADRERGPAGLGRAVWPRRSAGVASGHGHDGRRRPPGVPRAGRDARLHRVLARGDPDRRDRPPAPGIAPHCAARGDPHPARRPRYPVGVLLDAEPVQPARLVRARRRPRAGDPACLREMYAGWPFVRAVLDNAEMSLLKADMWIAARYSALVADRGLAAACGPPSRPSTRAPETPSSVSPATGS